MPPTGVEPASLSGGVVGGVVVAVGLGDVVTTEGAVVGSDGVGVAVEVADGALEIADGVGVGVVEPCCWAIKSSTCAVATCDVREMYASKPIAPAVAILVDFWSSAPNCQAGAAAPAGHARS